MTHLLLPLTLLACQPDPLCVDVVSATTVALSVSAHAGAQCDQPVLLDRIEVRGTAGPLWSVSVGDERLEIEQITYGVVPDGARGTDPKPLTAGEEVRVRVISRRGEKGSATVRLQAPNRTGAPKTSDAPETE